MTAIAPVKGTRDFYPQDMAFRRWLYEKIQTVSEQFGYQEFEGPFLERLALYAAKSGEELVKEQSFVFPDRGGDMVALRPELTPTLARMVATRSQELVRPIRWWSFGPFWRYERPQRGRAREFFQWNIDLLGVDSPQADAEIASIAAQFFRAVGLSEDKVRIKINDRRLVDIQLESIGIPMQLRPSVFRLIDRKEKLNASEWKGFAQEIGLDDGQFSGLAELLENRDAWRDSSELVEFFEAVSMMGVSDYMEYDPTVIRGLDYYTGTVFEARDAEGDTRAILGGGRYDDLVADVGGDPVPGVGFAMGDVVIGLMINESGSNPQLRPNPADVFLPTFDEGTRDEALKLAAELREFGVRVEWYPEIARLPKQLKYADRQSIPLAVLLGPAEIQSGEVTIKDLITGEQSTVRRAETAEWIMNRLQKSLD
jgi:histidyl-tRNA synthetase